MSPASSTRSKARGMPGSLVFYLAGGILALLLFFLLLPRGVERPSLRSSSAGLVRSDPSVEENLGLLYEHLSKLTDWERNPPGLPIEWHGRPKPEVGLVSWNARATALAESLGFVVLEGTEEILERRGKWPLQRLTLILGLGDAEIGSIVVEAPRPPTLPIAF